MLLYDVESNSQEHEILTNAVMDVAVKAAEHVFFEVNWCIVKFHTSLHSALHIVSIMYLGKYLHNIFCCFPSNRTEL